MTNDKGVVVAADTGSGSGLCAGRVVIVTGAGRGLGRAHALAFAVEGARVVVNDLGVGLDGAPAPDSPAAQVVEEIRALGGEAVAHGGDIATTDGAASLVATALDTFGRLDTLVNNAGFLRDRMLVNLDEDDWDAVVRVHLKGHFLPLKHAAAHWRAEAKAGRTPAARVVNTSSGAGLLGSVGQGNYSAAVGIVGLTLVAAAEMGRYGVQVNAVAPHGPHSHDGAHVRRHHGRPRGRLRRDGPGERVAGGGVARLRRERRRDRPCLRGGGRPHHGHGGLAPGPHRRQGGALDPGRGGRGGEGTPRQGGGAGGGVRKRVTPPP